MTAHGLAQYSFKYRWYVVIVMMAVYACNLADRALLSVLVEPIKAEFGVSDTMMGFLGGSLLAATYAVFSIPLGWVSDRVNRRNLLAVCLGIWSFMLPISGLARNFFQLAAAQVMATVGESGCPAAMSSLISDLFPRERRGLAIAVWISGVSLGMFFGYALGGYLADTFGWRTAFIAFALPGATLAILIKLTVRETPRGMADGGMDPGAQSPGAAETLQFFMVQKALRHAIYGMCLAGLAMMGPVYWLTAFFVRSHGISVGDAGIAVGVIIGITGVVGAPVGGFLMDRLGQRDIRWHAWILSLLLLISAVPMSTMYLSGSLSAAYAACFLWNFLGTAIPVINITIISNLSAAQYRGLTISLLLVLFNLIGHGLGSQIVGISSDWIEKNLQLGEQSLRYACLAMLVFVFWSAMHFWIAARHLKEGYATAARLERDAAQT